MNCWVIAVVCCIINFHALGIARLAPLLYVGSMERYNVNRKQASFPYVLCYVLRCLSGPLVGFMGRKYELRTVTLFGSFLSFIGIGACYFAEDTIAVSIFWGVIYGLGTCLGISLLPIVLDRTFEEKHKTKANGISLAGGSLGGILIPLIIDIVIEEYGLSGSFLIVSGLMLHCVPACLLLSASNLKKIASKNQKSVRSEPLITNGKFDRDTNAEKYRSSHSISHHEIVNTDQSETTEVLLKNSTLNKNSLLNSRDSMTLKISDESTLSSKDDEINNISVEFTNNESSGTQSMNSDKNVSTPYYKCVPNSTEPSKNSKLHPTDIINENDQIHETVSEPMICKEDATETTAKKKGKVQESLFRMFLDTTFLLIMVTQSLSAFIMMVVWTVVLDVVRDKGIDKSSEIYYLMLFPVADTIGRVGLGWITDGGLMSKTKFCVVSFMLLGLSTILFVFLYSPVMIMLDLFLFGFVTGGLIAVFPGIVCEFMSTSYKLMAMSSRSILLAPLTFTASPLIGYFREQRGSYDGVFYVLFACSLACGGMAALIPGFSQRSKSKLETEET